ncbi:hypothetical protein B0T22DRAFT_495394 [Podospora appendiculata]|uniref:25S rRNA (uridine-N(3))-methyltransferase BMT5-like domain-containing protein n=1 Tax=Podospora appendiculata TaxID=314037 RepID=A0AAE1CF11_9PEZI|nr:hypothetical protein B0T22DRAFT_495394 [Podospora appendiculata]
MVQKTDGGKILAAGPAGASSLASSSTKSTKSAKSAKSKPGQHDAPTIPFAAEETILLVGEADFSFAASLVEHHGCMKLTATVLEKNLKELLEKYPHARENVDKIVAAEGCRVQFGIDARKMTPYTRKGNGGREGPGPIGRIERIIFNFPHVGGKSTDVNRQVRYNQELLVDFFQRAMPSLAPGGSIIVTLFEGEPYTLWNIKDLARHAGLQVERSFRFQAAAYPGYHHSRTLGVVRNKQGEIGGGWKGEDRLSRSYVFVRKDETPKPVPEPKAKTKKGTLPGEEDSSSDEDE